MQGQIAHAVQCKLGVFKGLAVIISIVAADQITWAVQYHTYSSAAAQGATLLLPSIDRQVCIQGQTYGLRMTALTNFSIVSKSANQQTHCCTCPSKAHKGNSIREQLLLLWANNLMSYMSRGEHADYRHRRLLLGQCTDKWT